jgi:hypothetical protein
VTESMAFCRALERVGPAKDSFLTAHYACARVSAIALMASAKSRYLVGAVPIWYLSTLQCWSQRRTLGPISYVCFEVFGGGPFRARTGDPLIKSQLLYQLS